MSQVIRKRIEEANGWIKEVDGMAQTKFRGLPRVGWMFTLKATAYNLIHLPGLLATGCGCPDYARRMDKQFSGIGKSPEFGQGNQTSPARPWTPPNNRRFSATC